MTATGGKLPLTMLLLSTQPIEKHERMRFSSLSKIARAASWTLSKEREPSDIRASKLSRAAGLQPDMLAAVALSFTDEEKDYVRELLVVRNDI